MTGAAGARQQTLRLWHDDDVATDLLLGIGAAALLPCDAELVLAAGHPLAHPGISLQVTVEDDVVTSADVQPGLMHRSAEKLFESRDLRQAMLLADRHDWLSAFSSEVGVALALEAALGIIPPERATWTRTLLVEVNRAYATLAFLAPIAGVERSAAETLRERIVDAQERVTGARVHPGFARIGGVAAPIVSEDLDSLRSIADALTALTPRLAGAVEEATADLAGVAVLTREQAVVWGASGPVARASGLDLDLRRDQPSLAYAALSDRLTVPTRTAGDVPARYGVLVDQLPVTADLIRACIDELEGLGDGPVDVPLPKVVRLPEGTWYAWLEGPIGISGCLVVGAGEKTPWRMKIRSASFATAQAMGVALVGTPYPRLADAVMSFPMVPGDIDR
jgi:NADH-quinone oxidoreductase subunit D